MLLVGTPLTTPVLRLVILVILNKLTLKINTLTSSAGPFKICVAISIETSSSLS